MIISRIQRRLAQLTEVVRKLDELQQAVGRIELRLSATAERPKQDLREYEFKVFSEWGEDGIVQYLIRNVQLPRQIFVEFGVENYTEANTRFLLEHNNWSGLVIEARREQVSAIQKQRIYSRYELKALSAFVTRENINDLLRNGGIEGDIGLLSIDIDGNDYWVWEAIDCISPRIVICEYDSILGPERPVVSPYDPAFLKTRAHYSFLYGGASLAALELLGRRKGYTLVGSNSAGSNAFFVRTDVLGELRAMTPKEAYVRSKFRNSRDRQGNLTFLSMDEGLELIADLPLIDVASGEKIAVRDIPHYK